MKSPAQPHPHARAVLDAIRRLVRGLRLSSQRTVQTHRISAAQLFILHSLNPGPPINLNELARRTLTDQSSVSTALVPLVRRGLVEKRISPGDGRALALSLSPKGRRLLQGQPDAFQSRVVKATLSLSVSERRGLVRGLEKLVKGMGLSDQAAGMLSDSAQLRRGPRP